MFPLLLRVEIVAWLVSQDLRVSALLDLDSSSLLISASLVSQYQFDNFHSPILIL